MLQNLPQHPAPDRYQQGLAKLREIDGEAGERVIDSLAGIAPDFARYLIEFPFGDIYSRPGLTLAQRELLSLASLVTLGGLEPQLRGHTRGAIRVGCTPTEIIETVIHTVQYCGFPRALNALKVITDQLEELGLEIPPALGPDHESPTL